MRTKRITLDLSALDTKEALFDTLQEAFPDLIGRNFDALHDVLTALGKKTEIAVTGTAGAKEKYVDVLLRVLADSASENGKLTVVFRKE